MKASGFYQKVQSPVLTDITLQVGGSVQVNKTYPADLPDLFKGSSLMLLGRYKGEQERALVIITGKVKEREKRFAFEADFPQKNTRNDYIPPLWAARRIGYLIDQIRLHREDKESVGGDYQTRPAIWHRDPIHELSDHRG